MIFVLSGGVRGEHSEKLESDDTLNRNVMFLRPQRLQNEVNIVQKQLERRKKSRARTEKREEYADDRPGCVQERSRADRCPLGGRGRRPMRAIWPDRPYLLFLRFRLDFWARWLRNQGFGSDFRIRRFLAR